jgi:8-oxo-dGTP pyrophosphatase MutT (NUDIX family)
MAVIPRPASTVVLMDSLSRVYLTKRPETMKFFGGFHVFPGGAVEDNDHVINQDLVNTNLPDHSASPGFYIAAARELYEEAGILLGNYADGTPVELPRERTKEYRNLLLNDEISFTHLLEQEMIHLDLQCLSYMGQIITPEENPIRFDTRFFLAHLPEGQVPEPDQTEIAEAIWISPEEALAAYNNKQIKLAPPTIITLETIINYQKGGELMMTVSRDDLLKHLKRLRNI